MISILALLLAAQATPAAPSVSVCQAALAAVITTGDKDAKKFVDQIAVAQKFTPEQTELQHAVCGVYFQGVNDAFDLVRKSAQSS